MIAETIFQYESVFEYDFFEQFHIDKNHINVVNCDFSIPPLSDSQKSYIKSNFSSSFFHIQALQVPFLFFIFFINPLNPTLYS